MHTADQQHITQHDKIGILHGYNSCFAATWLPALHAALCCLPAAAVWLKARLQCLSH
jgi:hypothetical protein